MRKINSSHSWDHTAFQVYRLQCSYGGQSEEEMVAARCVFRFVPEFTEAMNNRLVKLGCLGSVTAEMMNTILSGDTVEWQKEFLKHVDSSIKIAAREVDTRSQARELEEVQRFRENKFECPPRPGFGTGATLHQRTAGAAGTKYCSVGSVDVTVNDMSNFEATMDLMEKMGGCHSS